MKNNKFGESLEKLISENDISAKELSVAIGIPYKTILEYIGKDGRVPSKIEVFKKLADHFEVPLHDLMFGEPDPASFVGQILKKTVIHTGIYEVTVKKVEEKK
jgi:hypothetical protein